MCNVLGHNDKTKFLLCNLKCNWSFIIDVNPMLCQEWVVHGNVYTSVSPNMKWLLNLHHCIKYNLSIYGWDMQRGGLIMGSNFLQNPNKRHHIAYPWGQGMECLLWVQTLIYILIQQLPWCMQYHVILDCFEMALGCTWVEYQSFPLNSTQNILPIHWKMYMLNRCKRACRFKTS